MITTKQGNSVELLKELESNSIDLLVTDPPYKVATGGVPSENNNVTLNKNRPKGILKLFQNLANGFLNVIEF